MNNPDASAPQKHLLIGLTGGIGSGKSTVAQLFEKLGVRIIDTDALSRILTQPDGHAIPAIRSAFGANFLDATGALDRTKMRELIFAEPVAKVQLEAILHPMILALSKQAAAAPTRAPYTLIVIPLLFESTHYQSWLHQTLVVDCTEATQLKRTMQRGGLSQAAVSAIMAQQASRTERLSRATEVLHNEGDLPSLEVQIPPLHQHYLALCSGSN